MSVGTAGPRGSVGLDCQDSTPHSVAGELQVAAQDQGQPVVKAGLHFFLVHSLSMTHYYL